MIIKKSPEAKWGHLLIFEGPDGVGKSTIVNKVTKYIKEQGAKVLLLSFPGDTPGRLGSLIYNIHHNLKEFGIKDISAASLQALHVAAHIDCIENQILPALFNGTTVLLDRYWWSTIVYGLANGVPQNALNLMVNAEKCFWGNVLPDIAFLITRNRPFRKEFLNQKWEYICRKYTQLAEQESKCYCVERINNTDPINEIIEQIMKLITTKFLINLSDHRAENKNKKKSNLKRDKWSPTKTTPAFDSYWHLAAERQEIFFKRLQGIQSPWTDDLILKTYKFTNAYRASDRVSQFLIRHVIYEGDKAPEEVFFRIILFKMFNKIETWQLLKQELGEVRYDEYNFKRYDSILTKARNNKKPIYSAAYIMPSGGNCFGYNYKHQNNLKLLESMMKNDLPKQINDSRSMQKVFGLFRNYPMIGDFLAYQYAIDINYSELIDFNEMSFVLPGPGAKDGIKKCFSDPGGLSEVDLIKLMAERQQDEFEKRNINFKNLWGRHLQLIDCQNLFCEIDKYSRIAHPNIKGVTGRSKIKQKYHITTKPIDYFYPPKWRINDAVRKTLTKHEKQAGLNKREKY